MDNDNNNGWSERDSLPTGDPIGDIVDQHFNTSATHVKEYTREFVVSIPGDPTLQLPNGCHIPIKDGVYDPYTEGHKRWKKDQEEYFEKMKGKLINSEGKNFGIDFIDLKIEITKDQCCEKPDKYENIVSNTMKFYSCKNCGADLGNIK